MSYLPLPLVVSHTNLAVERIHCACVVLPVIAKREHRAKPAVQKSLPIHQDHNVPWHIVASHLKVQQRDPHLERKEGTNIFRTPVIDTVPRTLPSQSGDLNHFIARLAHTIEDFSRIGRVKFTTDPAPLPRRGLTPDDLRLQATSTAEYPALPTTDAYGRPVTGWALESEALLGINTPRPLGDAMSILLAEGKARNASTARASRGRARGGDIAVP